MLSRDILQGVENAINDRSGYGCDTQILYLKDKKFFCKGLYEKVNSGVQIMKITKEMIKHGLSPREWELVYAQLCLWHEKGKI